KTLHDATGLICLITDRDKVITVAGAPQREFAQRPVGPVVIQSMEERRTFVFSGDDHDHPGPLIGEDSQARCPFSAEVISPIVVGGDPLGTVILCSREPDAAIGETERKLADTSAGFLSRHMEE